MTESVVNTPERVEFDVHANIISDLIHSQNGTVATAIRELVMNAIDGGSQRCEIMLNRKGFSVVDWGKGFESEEVIKTYFKNFGEPHKEGDAIHGRFRIGRGQIMAFAQAVWTSNQYAMAVDVKANGYVFDFTVSDEVRWEGCRIDGKFYEALHDSEIYRIKEEIQDYLCFADIEITFNGDVLNKRIEDEVWDIDDGEVLIQWRSGDGIKIYSQGVFVKRLDSYRFGFDARVVTRKAMVLNMARNELNESDPLWLKINEYLQQKLREVMRLKGKGGRIDTATRRAMVKLFLSGGLSDGDVFDICFLKDCRGHSLSLRNLVNSKLGLTVSPEAGSRQAETIATQRLAQVLDVDVLEEFCVGDLEELVGKITDVLEETYLRNNHTMGYLLSFIQRIRTKPLVEFDTIASKLVSDSEVYPKSSYSPREAAARNAIQHGSKLMARELSKRLERTVKPRNILLGQSDVADGWTNGVNTIVIARHILPYLDTLSRAGGFQVALLLLHEYLHDSDDSGSHQHDFEFMAAFHDASSDYRQDLLGTVGMGLYSRYLTELTKKSLDLPKKIRSEFNYPIVNDVARYVLSIKSKTLSPVAKTVLDWLGLPYKKEKGKVVITYNRNSSINKDFHLRFYKIAKQAGQELQGIDYYRSTYDDYETAYKLFKAAVAGALAGLLSNEKISDEFCLKLARARNFIGVLKALCSEPAAEVLSCSMDSIGNIRHTFSDKADYMHGINSPFSGQRWGDDRFLQTHSDHIDFAATKEGRMKYARQIIEHAFMGLGDENERRELANTILNDKGKELIISVAEVIDGSAD